MKILAVIAVRGGSKGVKDKNIRALAGKPLIAYTIEQAKEWGKYSRLILSTDSSKIADIARQYGAEVPFMRPAELAQDNTAKMDVLRHALNEAEEQYQLKFDVVLDLDVTAPIRTVVDIDNCVNLFRKKNPDCVFSAVKSRKSPYFNMVEQKKNGTFKPCVVLSKKIVRRQDVPLVYDMNTSIYVYGRSFLLDAKNKLPYAKRALVYEMPEISGIDIDSELDFKFIEFLIKEEMVKL